MISISVGGIDTYKDLGLVMEVVKNDPPSPKFYTVDIPGGNGVINITKALTNDTVYNNREIQLRFTLAQEGVDFEKFKTELFNRLHGQEADFSLSFDEGYTYHGWFSFDSQTKSGNLKQLDLTIDADPYKSKGTKTECFNVSGGVVARLSSGRKQVRPTFEFSADTIVVYEGNRYVIPKGTHTINDVWFKNGVNEITFIQAGIQSCITHEEMARLTHQKLAMRKIWELYKGVEKHFIERIEFDGTETPVTGAVTFTATDSGGNTVTRVLDLGDLKLTVIDGIAVDKVIVSGDYAVVYKNVEVAGDGTKSAMLLPETYTLDFPQIYSNEGEITALACDAAVSLSYSTGKINSPTSVRAANHEDYMGSGSYAMTNSQMSAYNHAKLTMINVDGSEVFSENQESVYVQYEWQDL